MSTAPGTGVSVLNYGGHLLRLVGVTWRALVVACTSAKLLLSTRPISLPSTRRSVQWRGNSCYQPAESEEVLKYFIIIQETERKIFTPPSSTQPRVLTSVAAMAYCHRRFTGILSSAHTPSDRHCNVNVALPLEENKRFTTVSFCTECKVQTIDVVIKEVWNF